jgi:hypothetical protein
VRMSVLSLLLFVFSGLAHASTLSVEYTARDKAARQKETQSLDLTIEQVICHQEQKAILTKLGDDLLTKFAPQIFDAELPNNAAHRSVDDHSQFGSWGGTVKLADATICDVHLETSETLSDYNDEYPTRSLYGSPMAFAVIHHLRCIDVNGNAFDRRYRPDERARVALRMTAPYLNCP